MAKFFTQWPSDIKTLAHCSSSELLFHARCYNFAAIKIQIERPSGGSLVAVCPLLAAAFCDSLREARVENCARAAAARPNGPSD